jgi:hypothetical protein
MRDSDDGAAGRRAEIYTYESNTLVYAMNWSVSVEASTPYRCNARKQHALACMLAVQQRCLRLQCLACSQLLESSQATAHNKITGAPCRR